MKLSEILISNWFKVAPGVSTTRKCLTLHEAYDIEILRKCFLFDSRNEINKTSTIKTNIRPKGRTKSSLLGSEVSNRLFYFIMSGIGRNNTMGLLLRIPFDRKERKQRKAIRSTWKKNTDSSKWFWKRPMHRTDLRTYANLTPNFPSLRSFSSGGSSGLRLG